jgi:preprotein translocase subunit SecB
MKEQIDEPVFLLDGYCVKNISFSQSSIEPRIIETFGIKADNVVRKKGAVSFDISVKLSGSSFSGSYTFSCFFRINDEKWADDIPGGNSCLVSILFSSVFSFIRQIIFSSTGDSFFPLMLPIIDMRAIDITKGASFSRTVPNEKQMPQRKKG